MDRTSGDEVGGPYATEQDAERALERGSVGRPSSELKVEEEPREDGPDSDDDSKQASLHESSRRTSSDSLPNESPVSSDSGSQNALGPQDPPFEGHGLPMPQQQVPQTTKPSQLPEGGGGQMPPGGMAEMPMGMSLMTPMPTNPPFDPAASTPDPVGSKVNAVATLIQRQNPEMDADTVRRVARKVTAMLITSDWGWHPHEQHIEDPLHSGPMLPRFLRPSREPEHERGKRHISPHDLRLPDVLRTHDWSGAPTSHAPAPTAQQPEEPEEPRRNEEETGEPERYTEEPVDLTEFDKPISSSLPHPGDQPVWPPPKGGDNIRRGSFHQADWGWTPMEQSTEIPSMDSGQQDQGGKKQDQGGGGGGSSLPSMPKLPGMGGGGGGAAAGGAGEAAGGAAVAEEALPLLLV